MKAARAKRHNRKVGQSAGTRSRPRLTIPSILLEGDTPAVSIPRLAPSPRKTEPEPVATPPAVPYALSIPEVAPPALAPSPKEPEKFVPTEPPAAPAQNPAVTPAPGPVQLPEAYGTKQLALSVRNPNWIYAHWDLTREQLQDYNSRSQTGHLSLRLYDASRPERLQEEIKLHPESRNWFLRVGTPGADYRAELGYYPKESGAWVTLSTSNVVTTPVRGVSEDTSVEFETLSPDLPFQDLIRLARNAMASTGPLPEFIEKMRSKGIKGALESAAEHPLTLTPEQQRKLSELVSLDEWRRTWMGSFEITEALKRKAAEQGVLPNELWSGGVSSPAPVEGQKPFWFNVNAELIVYGATEPDAQIAIGGRSVNLRPDGSFSFRFALPDGNYALPAVATSADGKETRSAALHFSRTTDYQGEVEKAPQDSELGAPTVDNLA